MHDSPGAGTRTAAPGHQVHLATVAPWRCGEHVRCWTGITIIIIADDEHETSNQKSRIRLQSTVRYQII